MFNTDIKSSERLLGSSFKIYPRIDRQLCQHGALLIAQSSDTSLRNVDINNTSFDFAISCAVLGDKVSFFVLIHNPPASSNISVDFFNLLDCVQSSYVKFNLASDNLNSRPDNTVYSVGDFNFPTMDWTIYLSSSCKERRFLGMVNESDFFQVVCEPTHNNIPDLVLSKIDNSSVSVSKQFFSDHFLVHFHFDSSPVPIFSQTFCS